MVTSRASATREAPAQAELRPTCAGAPRVNLPLILALMVIAIVAALNVEWATDGDRSLTPPIGKTQVA
jgi:hypothetical protein